MLALQINNTVTIPSQQTTLAPVTPIRSKQGIQGSTLSGSVTEIVVQQENFSNIPMLMPLLAQLSKDERWFIWIAPPKLLPKAQLIEAGIDLNKVIVLNPNNKHSVFELAKQALSTGTSHAVVSWPGYISEQELSDLEQAAKRGCSHGIVIRQRQCN